jgi:hypothetical protein
MVHTPPCSLWLIGHITFGTHCWAALASSPRSLEAIIGLPWNKGQDFGLTPNKRPDYENPMFYWR